MAYVPDDHHHAEHASHGHPNYWAVFLLLCVCTGASWLLDELENLNITLPAMALVIAVLAVALLKAGAVMTYFMHLKFEGNWKFIILMPTAILAVGLMVALAPDMALHYYTPDSPQSKSRDISAAHGLPGMEHGHGDEGHSKGGASENHDHPAPAHAPEHH